MSFGKIDYVDRLNALLLAKRFDGDVVFNLNIQEGKLIKNAEKFNYCLRKIYEDQTQIVSMYHVILAIREYFDSEWLFVNVLDEINKNVIKEEMKKDFNRQ
jgi:hypothetical protein